MKRSTRVAASLAMALLAPSPARATFTRDLKVTSDNTDLKTTPTDKVMAQFDNATFSAPISCIKDIYDQCDAALAGSTAGAAATGNLPAIASTTFSFLTAQKALQVLRGDATAYAYRPCYNFLSPTVGIGLGSTLDSMISALCTALNGADKNTVAGLVDPGSTWRNANSAAWNNAGFSVANTVAMFASRMNSSSTYTMEKVFASINNSSSVSENTKKALAKNHRGLLGLRNYQDTYVSNGFKGSSPATSFMGTGGLFTSSFTASRLSPGSLSTLRAKILPSNATKVNPDSLYQILRNADALLFNPETAGALAPRAAFILGKKIDTVIDSVGSDATLLPPYRVANFSELHTTLDYLLSAGAEGIQMFLKEEAASILRKNEPDATSFITLYENH